MGVCISSIRRLLIRFLNIEKTFSIERDVFPSISNLYALETDATWIDIGVPERLEYARQHFQNGVFR